MKNNNIKRGLSIVIVGMLVISISATMLPLISEKVNAVPSTDEIYFELIEYSTEPNAGLSIARLEDFYRINNINTHYVDETPINEIIGNLHNNSFVIINTELTSSLAILGTYLKTTEKTHYVFISGLNSFKTSGNLTNINYITGMNLSTVTYKHANNSDSIVTFGEKAELLEGCKVYSYYDSNKSSDSLSIIVANCTKNEEATADYYQMSDNNNRVISTQNNFNNISLLTANTGYLGPTDITNYLFDIFLRDNGFPLKQKMYSISIADMPHVSWNEADMGSIDNIMSNVKGSEISIGMSIMGHKEEFDYFIPHVQYTANSNMWLSYHCYDDAVAVTGENIAENLTKFDAMISNFSFLSHNDFKSICQHGYGSVNWDSWAEYINIFTQDNRTYNYILGCPWKYDYIDSYNVSGFGVLNSIEKHNVIGIPNKEGVIYNLSAYCYSGWVDLHPPNFSNATGSFSYVSANNLKLALNEIFSNVGSVVGTFSDYCEDRILWDRNDIVYGVTKDNEIIIKNYENGIMFSENNIDYDYYTDSGEKIYTIQYIWDDNWKTIELVGKENEIENKIEFTTRYTSKVQLEVPSDWNETKLIVTDETTGEEVEYTIGNSISFNGEQGHTYSIMTRMGRMMEDISIIFNIAIVLAMMVVIIGMVGKFGKGE